MHNAEVTNRWSLRVGLALAPKNNALPHKDSEMEQRRRFRRPKNRKKGGLQKELSTFRKVEMFWAVPQSESRRCFPLDYWCGQEGKEMQCTRTRQKAKILMFSMGPHIGCSMGTQNWIKEQESSLLGHFQKAPGWDLLRAKGKKASCKNNWRGDQQRFW